MTVKKKYEKPKITVKKLVITDIISSSGVTGNNMYLGGYEYRY